MYRLYTLKTNKNARTICASGVNSTGWKHQCNKWDYKGTSLHKRNENTAYRELKECITTAQSQLGGEKQNLINIYRIQCDPILQNLHTVSSLFLCSFSWLSGSPLWLLWLSCLSDWSLPSPCSLLWERSWLLLRFLDFSLLGLCSRFLSFSTLPVLPWLPLLLLLLDFSLLSFLCLLDLSLLLLLLRFPAFLLLLLLLCFLSLLRLRLCFFLESFLLSLCRLSSLSSLCFFSSPSPLLLCSLDRSLDLSLSLSRSAPLSLSYSRSRLRPLSFSFSLSRSLSLLSPFLSRLRLRVLCLSLLRLCLRSNPRSILRDLRLSFSLSLASRSSRWRSFSLSNSLSKLEDPWPSRWWLLLLDLLGDLRGLSDLLGDLREEERKKLE